MEREIDVHIQRSCTPRHPPAVDRSLQNLSVTATTIIPSLPSVGRSVCNCVQNSNEIQLPPPLYHPSCPPPPPPSLRVLSAQFYAHIRIHIYVYNIVYIYTLSLPLTSVPSVPRNPNPLRQNKMALFDIRGSLTLPPPWKTFAAISLVRSKRAVPSYLFNPEGTVKKTYR